jgi:6-phosphogluconolactonase (cycloisomerase 2 family)
MRTRIYILALIAVIAVTGAASAKQKVAIVEFKGINVEGYVPEAVVEIMSTSLIDSGAFEVIERSQIEKVFGELNLQSSDEFDEDQAQELGQLLGAGESTTFDVRFMPVDKGTKSPVIMIGTDDGGYFMFSVSGVAKGDGGLVYDNSYISTNINSAEGVVVSPDGKHVYVTSSGNSSVTWFSRSDENGSLNYLNQYSNTNINGALNVTCSPDGKNVYVTSGANNAVSWFSRNEESGALSYIDNYSTSMLYPTTVTVSPDGMHVYVAIMNSDAVAWFSRDSGTGALTYLNRYTSAANIPDAHSVKILSSGEFVYVSGGSSVAWFSRNSSNGALTYIDKYSNVTELNNARDLILSNDGMNVYAVGMSSSTLVTFSRDATSGSLSYMHTYTNDTNTIAGIFRLVVTPDDNNIYAVCYNLKSITWFSRNIESGLLTFMGDYSLRIPVNVATLSGFILPLPTSLLFYNLVYSKWQHNSRFIGFFSH